MAESPGLSTLSGSRESLLSDDAEDFDQSSYDIIDEYMIVSELDIVNASNQNDSKKHFRRKDHLDDVTSSDKMKTKVTSVWNSIKYGGWANKSSNMTSFQKRKPIFMLGKCYDNRGAESDQQRSALVKLFREDFTSRIWFTYRSGFCEFTDTRITSDGGWGCMIRSAQMILAQGLLVHYLSRDWNLFNTSDITLHKADDGRETILHREIVRWFADVPCASSPFSIHRLVNIGKSLGKKAGDWYGPASVATILEKACGMADEFVPLLRQISLYVAQDCTLYTEDVIAQATQNGRYDWKGTIILVPTRLGGSKLNADYTTCLKMLFAQNYFLGIIGGKPKHSLYFVGFQGEKLIHLDPHYIQDAVDTSSRDFPIQSFHCAYPRKLAIEMMDPSCTLGFYCRTREEFDQFVRFVPAQLVPPNLNEVGYPIFTIKSGSRKSDLASLSRSSPEMVDGFQNI